jgi:hypothetical protein
MISEEKLISPAPHKLLALDGGGIRGVISLGILAEIERMLQQELGRDNKFVLADYFDYFGGTSTGAIIATCLSLGWRVDKIASFYERSGAEMFDKASIFRRFRYKFEDEKLAGLLREVFGERTTLGDDSLRTLLLLVMRNATTDSPWPVSNNPLAKYSQRSRDDCNLDLPLWQLVRASTAAPTFFPPETLKIGKHQFVFVDGGVTMYNNPAFQLFLMATLAPYRLCWPAGEKEMLLVSIGTGTSPDANNDLMPEQMNLLYNAGSIPAALMYAASNEQDLLCRAFGSTRWGDELDREVGTMMDPVPPLPCAEPATGSYKMFTYVRYNALLSDKGLKALGLPNIVPAHVQKMDSTDHIRQMTEIGRAAATASVRKEHFNGFLTN